MLNDHAPSLRDKQRAEQENKAMEELEQRGAPLLWAVYVAAVLLVIGVAVDGWQQYAELAAQNEAMIQCLNGKVIGLGDSVLHCEIVQHKLVAGLNHAL